MDASVAVKWLFQDEQSDVAEKVFRDVHKRGGSAPSLFLIEVSNALVVGLRRRRISDADMQRSFDIMRSVPISLDEVSGGRVLSEVTKLARLYDLSVYDAMYLELAMRLSLPLATFDEPLRAAAKRAGVKNWIKL